MTPARPQRRLLAAIFTTALVLRLLRAGARWHEDAWLYSVYPAEVVDLVRTGAWHRVPFTFTGLHPPAWPVWHSVLELADPRPVWWLLGSVGWSVAAVWLVARRSVVAGLLLATAPVAVHYSAEVNQYPLLLCALAGLWTCEAPAEARVHRGVVLWGGLAAWTHLLGGVAAMVAAATLPRRQRSRTVGALAVCGVPLLPGVWAAMGGEGTFGQPGLEPSLVWSDAVGRFGGLGLVVVAAAAVSARASPRLAAGVVAAVGTLLVMVLLRIAAPHQFPYWLTVMPPMVLLAARAERLRWLLVAVAMAQGAWQLGFDGQRVGTVLQDVRAQERAVDVAIQRLETPWSCPTHKLEPDCSGDALVLLRPPGRNDDDKTRTSAVLWRVLPTWRAPRVALPGIPLSSSEYRAGQPRLVSMPHGRFVVYVHDHPRDRLSRVVSDHARAHIVVSEVGAHSDFLAEVAERTGATFAAVGTDWLWSSSPTTGAQPPGSGGRGPAGSPESRLPPTLDRLRP